MRPLGFVLPVAPGTFPAQASGGSSSEETSGAIASRRGVARAQRGWPALSPVGTAVPESQDRWAPHYRGTGSQVLASGRVIVLLWFATRAPPRPFSPALPASPTSLVLPPPALTRRLGSRKNGRPH